MAAKKQTGTAVAAWDKRLAEVAAMQAEAEANTGQGKFISVRAGVLSFNGSPVEGNQLDVVVLDSIHENAYYEGDFDPDNPQPPACYAYSHSGKDMKPHEQSGSPQGDDKQGMCQGCAMNEFGSAEKGRGKACKNIRRLALIAVDGKLNADKIAASEIAYLKVPVTSVNGWAAHVKSVQSLLGKPTWGVVTRIAIVPDPKSQFKVTFKVREEIRDSALINALGPRWEQAQKEIVFPYPQPEENAPKKGARGSGRGNAKPQRRAKY